MKITGSQQGILNLCVSMMTNIRLCMHCTIAPKSNVNVWCGKLLNEQNDVCCLITYSLGRVGMRGYPS